MLSGYLQLLSCLLPFSLVLAVCARWLKNQALVQDLTRAFYTDTWTQDTTHCVSSKVQRLLGEWWVLRENHCFPGTCFLVSLQLNWVFVFHEARVIFKNLMFGGFLRLLQLYTLFIITQKNKHYTVTLTAPAQQRHVPVHHFRKQELVPVPESTMWTANQWCTFRNVSYVTFTYDCIYAAPGVLQVWNIQSCKTSGSSCVH